MPNVIVINGRDLADFGFIVESFEGPSDGVVVEMDAADAPGRYGAFLAGPEGTVQAREVVASGFLSASSPAALDATYTALKDWISRGMVEIRTGLNLAKVFHGWYRESPGNAYPPQLASDSGSLRVVFRCFDPLGYDEYERVIALSAAPAQLPQSNGPLAGAIRVKGQTTSPLTIIARDHAGRVIATLTLGYSGNTFTLGANDRVEINSLAGTITRFTAGVASDAMPYMVPASDFPIIIGKDASDRAAPSYATLEISTGLATGASGEWIGARTHE